MGLRPRARLELHYHLLVKNNIRGGEGGIIEGGDVNFPHLKREGAYLRGRGAYM